MPQVLRHRFVSLPEKLPRVQRSPDVGIVQDSIGFAASVLIDGTKERYNFSPEILSKFIVDLTDVRDAIVMRQSVKPRLPIP